MNQTQALAVVCDLALSIGRENTLDALLGNALQRFLFHSGCPVGMVLKRCDEVDWLVCKVVGDHVLARQCDQTMTLPTELQREGHYTVTTLLRLPTVRHYGYALRLEIDDEYLLLLLSEQAVSHSLPLCQIFKPVLGNLGQAIRLCRDSEQLAARREQELRSMRRFNESLLHAIPIPVFYKDMSLRFIACNPAFSSLLDLDISDIRGRTAGELWPDACSQPLIAQEQLLLSQGVAQQRECQVCNRAGDKRKIIYFCDLFYDPRGQRAGLIGAFVDITEIRDGEARQRELLADSVSALSTAMLHRDRSTAGHEQRVSDLAIAIGKAMNLDADRLEGLKLAAMVHDIGLIQVPAEIITRPRRLSECEFALIKLHSEAGYDILKDIHFPWPLADIALQHHENIDGSGYPHGLKGDEILLEARIIRVADSIDAMLSHRPFRRCYTLDHALSELCRYKGSRYDPQVVDVCQALFAAGFSFNDRME